MLCPTSGTMNLLIRISVRGGQTFDLFSKMSSCDNQNIDDIYLPNGHLIEVFMTDTTMTARGEVLLNGGDNEGIKSRGFC